MAASLTHMTVTYGGGTCTRLGDLQTLVAFLWVEELGLPGCTRQLSHTFLGLSHHEGLPPGQSVLA